MKKVGGQGSILGTILLLGLIILFSCHAQAGENFEWTGEVGKEVSFAKYIGSRRDFSWNGQIGVNIEVLRYRRAHLYLGCNLETVMDKHFAFKPYDINYTIEPGVKFRGRFGDASFIFHHECHHDVDRFDGVSEQFNILGIRVESKEKDIWGASKKDTDWLWNLDKLASVGYYVSKSAVDYDWDAIAEAELNIVRHKKKVPYVRFKAHLVTRTSGKHFVDYIIEPGVKLRGPNGILSIFCQLWHKHDIDVCNGQTDNFALLGMRYNW